MVKELVLPDFLFMQRATSWCPAGQLAKHSATAGGILPTGERGLLAYTALGAHPP